MDNGVHEESFSSRNDKLLIHRKERGASGTKVFLSDGSSFLLHWSDADDLPFMVPLDEEMYRWIHGRDEAFRAYAKGFELCARREHSVLQLSRKLYRRGFSRESVADACSRLLSANALDDRRYAHVWTRSQINKKRHSRMFLAAKLAEAGIRQDIVDEALKEEFNPRDEKTALETAADRLFRKPGMTHEKCTQTLLRRGFSYKDIRVVLAEKSHE